MIHVIAFIAVLYARVGRLKVLNEKGEPTPGAPNRASAPHGRRANKSKEQTLRMRGTGHESVTR